MLAQQIRNSGSLLDSIDAIRNWRAVLLLLATLVAASVVFAVGGMLATVSVVLSLLFSLAALAVTFYGANAAGMMLMDEAQGHASRPPMAALMTSLATSHRLILVFLLLGAVYLVGFIALAIVLFLCKIPFLGPVLYAVVFPVSVVVAGVALFALPTVVFPLSAPSVWSGAGTMQCISQLLAIARKRMLLVVLLMVAVAFISGVIGFLIGAILFSGTAVTMGLSVPILGGSGMDGAMMGGFGMGVGGFGMGHTVAAAIGGGVLFAIAFTLPGMVYLRGACTVYLRAVDGLDLAAEQAAMDEKMAAAKAKAREMQAQAQARAEQFSKPPVAPVPPASEWTSAEPVAPTAPVAPQAAAAAAFTSTMPILPPAPTPAEPPPAGPAMIACPQCQAPVVPGDAFCGECGRKL